MAFSLFGSSMSLRKKVGVTVVSVAAAVAITAGGMSQASAANYGPSASRDCANKPYVTKGHAGPCVKVLQDALNKINNEGLSEDGRFGSRTLSALKQFQREQPGISADGYAGPATFKRLAECQSIRRC